MVKFNSILLERICLPVYGMQELGDLIKHTCHFILSSMS